MQSKLTKSQKQIHKKHITQDGKPHTIFCEIRYDDKCGNGHNSFAITGVVVRGHVKAERPSQVRDSAWEQCGCIHDDIRKHFPEFAHLIKWHRMSSDGPLGYIGNTTYLASTKDCWGLEKGEKQQLIHGRTKNPMWELVALVDGVERKVYSIKDVETLVESAEKPKVLSGGLYYAPCYRIGEGKEADLQAARNTAIWSDATLEQLQDKDTLEARLPALITEFKGVIEALGMEF